MNNVIQTIDLKPGDFYWFSGLRLCLTVAPAHNFTCRRISYLSSKGTVGINLFTNEYWINIL